MRSTMILAALAAILTLAIAPAMANFGADGGTTLQNALNDITVGADSSVVVTTDMLNDAYDSYWSIGGTSGSLSTIVIEVADYASGNKFGIYDMANPDNKVQLFDGPDSTGNRALVSIMDTGEVVLGLNTLTGIFFGGNAIGFYLDSSVFNGGGVFYSDTLLNDDGVDHMYAYDSGVGDMVKIGSWSAGPWLANEYILAWEDLYGGGDRDYADFVVMIESITPVPVPGAVLLGVLGLGAAGMRLRKRQS